MGKVNRSTATMLSTQLALLDALAMGLRNRMPCKGLIHHSVRGSQYASDDYRKALSAAGIDGSMSRKGDCVPTPESAARESYSLGSLIYFADAPFSIELPPSFSISCACRRLPPMEPPP